MTLGPFPIPIPVMPLFNPALLAGMEAFELFLIETQVTAVYNTLDEQIKELQNVAFTKNGAVPASAYGQGNEATTLSYEHGRAHNVIVDSLVEMRKDLGVFQDAILAAKAAIIDADEQAQADLQVAVLRTQGLDLGSPEPEPPTPGVPTGTDTDTDGGDV
ncbi:hypothetical protein [Nocardioides nitrophenolicus]|uniref:hypothetical protein n=1 Tax=Nocardioides nitrophenolicus TaxID=60489 RepID=UPI00195C41C9|nr:hypothetical protein [Nocardioides nitrophenolicus]